MSEDTGTAVSDNLLSSDDVAEEVTDQEASWLDSLEPEFREQHEGSLKKFKNTQGVAKSYLELERQSSGRVSIPGEDAEKEDWDSFYKKMGRPDDVAGYEFVRPEMEAGVPINEEMERDFIAKAHDVGLSKKQLGDIMGWHYERIQSGYVDQNTASRMQREQTVGELKKEWAGSYDKNLAETKRFFKNTGDKAAMQSIEKSGLANDPAFIKYAHGLSRMMTEGTIKGGESADSFGHDADSAKLEIEAIRKDTEHKYYEPYKNRNSKRNKEALVYMDNLYEMAYGGEDGK